MERVIAGIQSKEHKIYPKSFGVKLKKLIKSVLFVAAIVIMKILLITLYSNIKPSINGETYGCLNATDILITDYSSVF